MKTKKKCMPLQFTVYIQPKYICKKLHRMPLHENDVRVTEFQKAIRQLVSYVTAHITEICGYLTDAYSTIVFILTGCEP